MCARLVVCGALVGCGPEGGDEEPNGDPPPSSPGSTENVCLEAGAEVVLAGVVVSSLDACQISAVPPYGEIASYVENLQLAGIGQGYREQCVGVDDDLVYERVVQQYDLASGVWTQTDAIFDADGFLEWEAESERSAECNGGQECPNCCATYCCSGTPTSGVGSGRPHDLKQCLRTAEWQPS